MMENTIFGNREAVDAKTLSLAYRGVFTSPAGRMVLNDLCASLRLVKKPENLGNNAADARAFHDGERSIVLRILRMLAAPHE